MKEYQTMLMPTPGKKLVEVGVVEKRHEIKSSGDFRLTVPLLDPSGIKFTARCIQEHIINKRNYNVLVTGDPGLGKSTLISQIALEVDPNFSVDKVAFWLKDFDKIFQENPYGNGETGVFPQLSMDEAAHAMYGPEYMKEEQRVLAKNMIISRIKRQTIYFSTPKRKLLNPHVREMVNIWIHVGEPRPYLQGYARVRFAPPERQSEFHVEKYWEPKYAFIFGPMSGPWWEKYEEKKVAFLNEAAISKPKFNGDDTLIRIVTKNLKHFGMTQTEIAKILERGQASVSRILSSSSQDSSTNSIITEAE